MIPRVEFYTSYYLQSKILCSPYDLNGLNEFKNKLKDFFESKRKQLLEKIEDFSGIKWEKEYFPVWIFNGWQPSISKPIMVSSYGNDLDFCFFNLVHELIHNNKLEIKNKEGDWDLIEIEAIVNIITTKVLEDIYSSEKIDELSKLAEFRGYYKYVWLRVEEIKKEMDEKNQDFKEWLKINPKIKNGKN
jgi:hypothetical protein